MTLHRRVGVYRTQTYLCGYAATTLIGLSRSIPRKLELEQLNH